MSVECSTYEIHWNKDSKWTWKSAAGIVFENSRAIDSINVQEEAHKVTVVARLREEAFSLLEKFGMTITEKAA